MRFWNRKTKDPFTDPDSFGNIAIEKNYLTKEQLQNAVQRQQERLPLGEVLVQMGLLDDLQKDEILIEQRRRRSFFRTSLAQAELDRQKKVASTIRSSLAELQSTAHELTVFLKKT
jgi:hypothetical protein